MNHITIELCAEDRARLDRLAAALETRACDKCVSVALSTMSDLVNDAPAKAEPDETATASHPVESPFPDPAPVNDTPAAPEVSLAEFQKALTVRCAESDETKAKVRALLHEYAPAASQVPAEKRAEVLARLAEM